MSLLTLLLMLVVAAVIVKGVMLAFAGAWKELVILIVILIVALWILSALGLTLPSVPTIK